ncbi:CSN-associated deubiquitinating enzyme Ubp12 [Chytriomyces hyalinus]|nr:CSN-associated deubiquitinating enzyme Ubp12 [Chytriomyces hyalinus]
MATRLWLRHIQTGSDIGPVDYSLVADSLNKPRLLADSNGAFVVVNAAIFAELEKWFPLDSDLAKTTFTVKDTNPLGRSGSHFETVEVLSMNKNEAELDNELPTSTDILGSTHRKPVSFTIPHKETKEEKRTRIFLATQGVSLSDETPSASKAPLLLGEADPNDTTIVSIPSADSAGSSDSRFPGAGRTLGSSSTYTAPTVTMTPAAPPAVPSRPKVTPGAMGLTNLGNTCFMNSALQCLSNSAHLTSYFLSERWNQELNPDNPLGMNGEVAVAYAGLMRELWKITNDDSRYGNQFAPRNFKSTIGRFNQTFLGYSQQDSQELLQFLLDGLHEDLNRIKKKPYVEQPEMEGRPDAEIASKAWELYRLRNDSQIVDLFQGEYKSRVECVECGNWSVKFDPYMFLSVPVPEKREVVVNVIVVGSCFLKRGDNPDGVEGTKNASINPLDRVASSMDETGLSRSSSAASLSSYAALSSATSNDPESIRRHEKLIKLSFTLPRDATIQTLKTRIAKRMGWRLKEGKRRIVVVEEYANKIYKTFHDWDRVSDIKPADHVYAHELVDPDLQQYGLESPEAHQSAPAAASRTTYVPLYIRISDTQDASDLTKGVPLLIPVPAELSIPVSVAPEYAAHVSSGLWKDLAFNKMGAAVYELAIQNLRRFSKVGLYKSEQVDGVNEAEFAQQLVDEFERQMGGFGSSSYSSIPPAPRSDVDNATIEDLYPTTSATANLPRSGPIFESLIAYPESQPESGAKCIRNLFKLRYIQGDPNVGVLDNKDGFYYNHGYRAEKLELNTNGEGVPSLVYRKRKSSPKRAKVSVLEPDGSEAPHVQPAAAEDDSEEAEEGEPDEIILASKHENKRLYEYKKFALDDDGENFLISDVPIASGGKGKGGSDFAHIETISMAGELVLVAEFSTKMAAMLFGEEVLSSYRKDIPAFEAEDAEEAKPTLSGQSTTNSNKKDITLSDCLTEFMKEEIMGDEDTWYCPKCKDHKKIKKKLDVWSVPDNLNVQTLVLHLKRFSQTGRGFRSMSSNKIDALVDFPVNGLDLSDFVIGKEWMKQQEDLHKLPGSSEYSEADDSLLMYDLFAVSNHFGGLGGGHYTAYAKNPVDSHWYNFDDSHVSKISESSVVTPAAYMLFYQRRSRKNTHDLNEMIQFRQNNPSPPEQVRQGYSSYSSSSMQWNSPSSYNATYSTLGPHMNRRGSSPSSVETARSGGNELESNLATLHNPVGFGFGGVDRMDEGQPMSTFSATVSHDNADDDNMAGPHVAKVDLDGDFEMVENPADPESNEQEMDMFKID